MAEPTVNGTILWRDLSSDVREALAGKLAGLWGHSSDEEVFDTCSVAKQQTILIMVSRLQAKDLWHVVKKIGNVWGDKGEGVGMDFSAWPVVKSTLTRRKDFTRLMANHKDTTGGFYEKGRSDAVLHFLYTDGETRTWSLHFDLYSPVHSPGSIVKHVRHEFLGKLVPDWRMIKERLNA
jgi:hypothetical protein